MTSIQGQVVQVQGNQVIGQTGGVAYVNQGVVAQPSNVVVAGSVSQSLINQVMLVNTAQSYMTYAYVVDPLQDIANCTGALIKQEAEFMEAVTGCETPNRYHVFAQGPNGLIYLFKCNERSGCCSRHFATPAMRSFDMEIKHISSVLAYQQNQGRAFATAVKPFKCNCICCSRPEMTVTKTGDSQCVLGKIRMPWTCCDPKYEVYDGNGDLKYVVKASCMQCGLCCSRTRCGKLSEATFEIFCDKECTHQTGDIYRKVSTKQELVTKADSYQINFPTMATPQEKITLIGLGLMIDYQYFEEDVEQPKEAALAAQTGK